MNCRWFRVYETVHVRVSVIHATQGFPIALTQELRAATTRMYVPYMKATADESAYRLFQPVAGCFRSSSVSVDLTHLKALCPRLETARLVAQRTTGKQHAPAREARVG